MVAVLVHLPPKPVPDADTQPFWDSAARHRLVVPRCAGCARWIWQPRPLCPSCHGDVVWTAVSGTARVVSWTVLHPPVLPVWQDKVPFVVLLVELDDAPGVRMVGQLIEAAGGGLAQSDDGVDFGTRVVLGWRTDEAGTMLPAWTFEEVP